MLLSENNRLLLCDVRDLIDYDSKYKDILLWSQLYKLINTGVMFVDRSKKIDMPYKFYNAENTQIPEDIAEFNKNYEDLCNQRALDLFNYSKNKNLPIYILYSGGIDSTLMLVSFLKTIPLKELKENIFVTLNNESIIENPNFYNTYIKNNFNTFNSENFNLLFNGKCIILGGEHNDQLFGSDILGKIKEVFPFEDCLKPHSEKFIAKFFHYTGMDLDSAKWWYNLLKWHAEQFNFNIDTNYKLLWWLNFCFKWQSVFFRIILRAGNRIKNKINQNFIDNYFFHFYNTIDFQKWALKNESYKIINSWNTYKYEAKKIIYEYNNDKNYFDYKLKVGSLYKIFLYRNIPWGLTQNYQYIDKYTPGLFETIYNKNNSFVID